MSGIYSSNYLHIIFILPLNFINMIRKYRNCKNIENMLYWSIKIYFIKPSPIKPNELVYKHPMPFLINDIIKLE